MIGRVIFGIKRVAIRFHEKKINLHVNSTGSYSERAEGANTIFLREESLLLIEK